MAEQYKMNERALWIYLSLVIDEDLIFNSVAPSAIPGLDQMAHEVENNFTKNGFNGTTLDLISAVSYKLEEVIHPESCTWAGDVIRNGTIVQDEHGCRVDYFDTFPTARGLCFSFNYQKEDDKMIMIQKRAGPNNALRIKLNIFGSS